MSGVGPVGDDPVAVSIVLPCLNEADTLATLQEIWRRQTGLAPPPCNHR